MATPDTYPERVATSATPHVQSTLTTDRRILQRSRERLVAHRRVRLVSPRSRRRLAQWLRETARDANDPNPIRRWQSVLLHYRAAAVRTELLEIAALLEQARDPDVDCVAAVRELLRDGASPLYHPGVHVSELYITLDSIRAGLALQVGDHRSPAGEPRQSGGRDPRQRTLHADLSIPH
jgi:hypothetical protein